jgi:hypothetical protein
MTFAPSCTHSHCAHIHIENVRVPCPELSNFVFPRQLRESLQLAATLIAAMHHKHAWLRRESFLLSNNGFEAGEGELPFLRFQNRDRPFVSFLTDFNRLRCPRNIVCPVIVRLVFLDHWLTILPADELIVLPAAGGIPITLPVLNFELFTIAPITVSSSTIRYFSLDDVRSGSLT